MILAVFFVSLILSSLPLINSSTDRNISIPICPESFSCPDLPPFKYPFYNKFKDSRCGLIKISCTSTGAEIQLGERSYEILGNIYSHNISNLLYIKRRTFGQLVKNKSCEALADNFTLPSPSPLLYSISIASFITLFKCTKNLTYFEPQSYKSYTGCKDHNYYYNYGNETVPSDLPHTCQVADFGLSRLIQNNAIHVSTVPQGTPGYVDPQYHQRYQLTDKSDVYSFGVVLIQLISSMVAVDFNRSQDEINLASLALNRIQISAVDQLIDPVLRSDTNPETMNMIILVAELAFRCLQYDSDMRPTMNEVLDVLMDIQSVGRIDSFETIRDWQNVNVPPLSETSDVSVLLKDFQPTPFSVTSEWQSNSSASTTLSSSGDRLSMKNDISTIKYPWETRMT
ncbi:hypothetical protein M8C21_011832 [Ambrosia artemisiifolia]|uniref:Protein kinase domain-containing protein n=1 Tax=Ambrosia artemisiifolia TaxID=4212 RepID=A0AAD5CKK6_AMBAR|nr:hypothetical protein M8C21_011832 [Ambrosia artemisiifolia]